MPTLVRPLRRSERAASTATTPGDGFADRSSLQGARRHRRAAPCWRIRQGDGKIRQLGRRSASLAEDSADGFRREHKGEQEGSASGTLFAGETRRPPHSSRQDLHHFRIGSAVIRFRVLRSFPQTDSECLSPPGDNKRDFIVDPACFRSRGIISFLILRVNSATLLGLRCIDTFRANIKVNLPCPAQGKSN